MSVLSCAHTHTTFCDGKTPAEEMARIAYEKGFVSLGFSSHAPQTFDPGYCIPPEKEADYKAEILRLRDKYTGKMAVYLGLERDYFSCVSGEAYDYMIASVHYLPYGNGYASVDGDPQALLEYIQSSCGGSGLELAERYFGLLSRYVRAARPDIIGHFDLIRKNNARLHFLDENGAAYRDLALDALKSLSDTGAILEVNTGAVARGYLATPYPDSFLLSAWRQWGGEVMINSDCHHGSCLDCGFREAEALLRSLGYGWAVRQGKAQPWERYRLE